MEIRIGQSRVLQVSYNLFGSWSTGRFVCQRTEADNGDCRYVKIGIVEKRANSAFARKKQQRSASPTSMSKQCAISVNTVKR